MKSSKRFLAMMLSIIMATGVFTATALGADFDDVPSSHFASNAISRLVDRGVVVGMSARTFAPEAPVTRAQFSRMINLSFGFTEKDAVSFSDVPGDAWFADDIAIAATAGYLSGYDGLANPDGEIDRQSAASIAHRVYRLKGFIVDNGNSTTALSDISSAASWAQEGIQAMASHGIINGFPDGTFRPAEGLTRAQAAMLVVNMLDMQPTYEAEDEEAEKSDEIKEDEPNDVRAAIGPPSGGGSRRNSNDGGSQAPTPTPQPVVVLDRVTVLTPIELEYLVGEDLDLAGMVVTGIYSDGSKKLISSADYSISGYDHTKTGEQTVTVSYGGKSATFQVTVFLAVTSGALISITSPAAITVSYGAEKTAAGLRLPPRVKIEVEDGDEIVTTLANVDWNANNSLYDPLIKHNQEFTVYGEIIRPEGIDDPNDIALGGVKITVIVLHDPLITQITGHDSRFAPGYPVVRIDGEGAVTVTLKLNPGIATPEKPVIAYYAMDGWNTTYSTFDKESILTGHMIDREDPNWINYANGRIDEVVIYGDGEYSFDSGASLSYGYGLSAAIGIVLLDDDNLDDPLATATVIDICTEDDEDIAPYSMGAVFSTDGNKIFAYFNKKITNDTLNAEDFSLTNAGSITITSVTVDHMPQAGDYERHASWVEVMLSAEIQPDIQDKIVLIYNSSSSNVITDSNSIQASQIVWENIIPGVQNIITNINPVDGTMSIEFFPAIKYGSGAYQLTLAKDSIAVEFTPVSSIMSHSLGRTIEYFTFAEDISDTGDYTIEIEIIDGMSTFANSVFHSVAMRNVDRIMPRITTDSVMAEFVAVEDFDNPEEYHGIGGAIVLEFPADMVFEEDYIVGCSFILTVDGKRVLVRDFTVIFDNFALIFLNERRANIVSDGSILTITYDPNAAGHTQGLFLNGWMSDITNALLPGFGPVTVDK